MPVTPTAGGQYVQACSYRLSPVIRQRIQAGGETGYRRRHRKPEYLFDETGSGRNYRSNAYSDSLESALVLMNRLPSEKTARAIEQATEPLARVRPDGIVEDWHGDGTSIRTALMYVLKTQGTWLSSWDRGGASRGGSPGRPSDPVSHSRRPTGTDGPGLDYPRHREHWHKARNYPRLNEWPECSPSSRNEFTPCVPKADPRSDMWAGISSPEFRFR